MDWEIKNVTVVSPQQVESKASIFIKGHKIAAVGRHIKIDEEVISIDCNGLLAFPGFINCHDHLLGTYWPRVGDRRPYLNWLEWDNDLKSSPLYTERQQIDSQDLYQMGGYRHLLCGVTSVQDHIPHFVRELFGKEVPIRIISKYGLAHSVTSFALNWGEGIEKEHNLAKENNIPFITHCSEGFDEETIRSVETLHRRGALSKQTVLIHGIAFSDSDIDLLAEYGCHVVWCPVSNLYMFSRTAPVKKLLEKNVNVVLGTDSPMSGSINLFEELRVAQAYFAQAYGQKLSEKTLLQMVTTQAARAMCLHELGEIAENKWADIVLIDGDPKDPYQAFANMDYEHIRLVVLNGRPKYASEEFIQVFEAMKIPYQKILVAGHRKIVDGDILGLLARVRKAVKFHKILDFLPVEPW
ncbi:MAG: amidohydrolase family protein [Leptospiraceae bacterium]|nr:amidohydrolase family protein [Leptospiraceae bacterium]MDW8307260.1 amidohydrolase family protein [Leptospiraceae bacterium]